MNYSGIKNGSKVYLIDRFIRLFIKDNGERDVLYWKAEINQLSLL